jgi:hypothetical protein
MREVRARSIARSVMVTPLVIALRSRRVRVSISLLARLASVIFLSSEE